MVSRICFFALVIVLVSAVIGICEPAGVKDETIKAKHRFYDHLLEPREHPDYERYHVSPPDWAAFGNRTQFMVLRSFQIKDGNIINYADTIDEYTKTYDLGDLLWIDYSHIFANNFGEVVDEVKKRNLFIFDVYGYVPGSGPGSGPDSFWRQFRAPSGVFKMLEEKLGEHWLGMDNGEQDGRYIAWYAGQMFPASGSRVEQYFNFQRHFQRMCDDLGNKMSTLVSLNFGHYFLKEGVYTLIGAETAQALPNTQVYYSFIRGAGKQYGVPWFGNASVFNRWGYKSYETPNESTGPEKGTSLSLMKRLMYNQILYNSVAVGFESSFINDGKLSPIGRIQQSAKKWVTKNGQPGTMLTPIAVMVDFFSGWSFPRHLYTSNVYRVWGNLPYEAGDYLTDGVLDMLYPGYQDSSYFHDESGFISPTPYGDSADCLLSDSPKWLLDRYPVLIVAGELSDGAEIRDKLYDYAARGGRLFITAGSLAKLPGGLGGITIKGPSLRFKSSSKLEIGSEKIVEDTGFELYPLNLPSSVRVKVTCKDMPAVIEVPCGKGIITVFASPFGISSQQVVKEGISSTVDKPLPKPYPLLNHVRKVLDEAFRSQMAFDAGDGFSVVTCRKEAGLYTLGICNNSLKKKDFKITSHIGQIESIKELELDESEKSAVGYLPEGFKDADIGKSDGHGIAGFDIRIFAVRVKEENLEPVPHITKSRPRGRALPVGNVKSIKEAVLSRPAFFQHFDSIVVDWKYLSQRQKDVLAKQAEWIGLQKLGVVVDLTSGINLYPDLRLVNNLEEDYLASIAAIEDVIEKMKIIGSRDLILSLNNYVENNISREQTMISFEQTLRELSKKAADNGVKLHLRICFGKGAGQNLDEVVKLVDKVGAANLRVAPDTGLLIADKADVKKLADLLKGRVDMWLLSTPEFDIAGQLWNSHAKIAEYKPRRSLSEIVSVAPDAALILDGIYENYDQEYFDACALDDLAERVKH